MLIFLSPAKSLKFDINLSDTIPFTQPQFTSETLQLVKHLKKMSATDLKNLMHVSDNIAQLNAERYRQFHPEFTYPAAKPAAFVFTGEVYRGLNIAGFSTTGLEYAQQHIRILSGLYGILRPLDLIQPYRLEMGTKFSFDNYKNLYDFWKEKITRHIQTELKRQNSNTIINLASAEYFKVIDKKKLNAEIITPVFKDNKNGTYKTIMMYAKNARGKMAAFMAGNQITNPEYIKAFDQDGYIFNQELSNEKEWVFTRG